jgi:hypothetical protein
MRKSLLRCVPVTAVLLGLVVLPAAQAQVVGSMPTVGIGAAAQAASASPVHAAAQAATAAGGLASPAVLAAAGDAYVPVKPAVLAADIWARPGAPGLVTVRGRGGVPITGAAGAGVKAVVLQVEVSSAPSAGQLFAYSDTSAQPAAASVAYPRAAAVSQLVVVPFATGRQVKLAVSAGKAKLAVAVIGYYAAYGTTADGAGFAPVRPERVATVDIKGSATAGVKVGWIGGIPMSGVSAVVAEVSAVDPAAAGTLTVYPEPTAKSSLPSLPSVAFAAGVGSTGLVIAPWGKHWNFSITDTGGATTVTVEVIGYFANFGDFLSGFVPVPATKIGGTALTAGKPEPVTVTGTSGVPAAGATAVLLNVTASGATRTAKVTAYQAGVGAPVVTALTVGKGGTATGVISVQPGSSGQVTVAVNAGSARVAVAEVGYYHVGPAVPPVTSLHATAVLSSSTTLAWTAPAGTERIVILRATGGSPPTAATGSEVATLPPGTTSYTDTGLQSLGEYAYSVFATDSLGDAAKPATLLVGTQPGPGQCTVVFTGAASSAWDDAANWSTGTVPGPADWVCIPILAGNLPVTTGSSPITIAGFTNDGGLTIDSSQDGTYARELTVTDATRASTSSATLTLEGSLDAAGPVTVTGTLVPLSGQLNGNLTIMPLGFLQAPAQAPSADALPLELASGTLLNEGRATIGAGDGIDVLAGASLTNQGGFEADPASKIDVAAGGALLEEGFSTLYAGGLTLQSGGTLTIDRDSELFLDGNSAFADGSMVYDSGGVLVNALLTVTGDVLLADLSVDAGGTLELGPDTTVNAASTAFNGGGTLQLDAQADGNFGQLVSPGKAKPGSATLNLNAPAWTPACGTTVTALSAGTMLNGFGAVDAEDLAPGTATWQPEQTATMAGATLTCT